MLSGWTGNYDLDRIKLEIKRSIGNLILGVCGILLKFLEKWWSFVDCVS
jgi:hypothetical protein